MIEIPLGKALVPVEINYCGGACEDCALGGLSGSKCGGVFNCTDDDRKDGKSVIFKLVDLPAEEKRAMPEFGDYVEIEQKRYGVENEMYLHKVICSSNSNAWVDVPVQGNATETLHKEMEPVVRCICCGVCEDEVRRYRIKDIVLVRRRKNEQN